MDEEKVITEGLDEWRSGHCQETKDQEGQFTRHNQLIAFHAGARWQQRREVGRSAMRGGSDITEEIRLAVDELELKENQERNARSFRPALSPPDSPPFIPPPIIEHREHPEAPEILTEECARDILGAIVQEYNGLGSCADAWVMWPMLGHENEIELDGIFTADELEAMAWWMRNFINAPS